MSGSFPPSMSVADLSGNRFDQRDGLFIQVAVRGVGAARFSWLGLSVVRLLWSTSSSFAHGRVAFAIAESEDVLQRDADMWQVFLDVGPPVIFLVKLRARGAGNARACVRILAAPI